MKIFVFLHADESANRDEFQRHCLAVEGPRLLREFPQMRGLTMNLVIDPPAVVQPRPYELLSPFRRCEVIVTALFEDEAAARDFTARATFRARLAEFRPVSGKTIFGEPRVAHLVRRVDVQQHGLRQRDQRRAENALEKPCGHDHSERARHAAQCGCRGEADD